ADPVHNRGLLRSRRVCWTASRTNGVGFHGKLPSVIMKTCSVFNPADMWHQWTVNAFLLKCGPPRIAIQIRYLGKVIPRCSPGENCVSGLRRLWKSATGGMRQCGRDVPAAGSGKTGDVRICLPCSMPSTHPSVCDLGFLKPILESAS